MIHTIGVGMRGRTVKGCQGQKRGERNCNKYIINDNQSGESVTGGQAWPVGTEVGSGTFQTIIKNQTLRNASGLCLPRASPDGEAY
eukprot:6687594-Pyramimonas_sp.AAC.1